MKRYEALAASIAQQIRDGNIPPGARLPSLRQIMVRHGASQTTGARAYYLLEQWGLIRARDRSGFYVSPKVRQIPVSRNQVGQEPASIDVGSLVYSVLDSVRHRDIVPLGSAFPSPQLFPLARLAKSLAHAARMSNLWSTVADLPLGNEHLRQHISLRYVALGIPQPTDEILITSGGLEALNLCLAAVARPGDCVAIESPAFYGCLHAVQRMGLKAVEIPVDRETGISLPDLETALRTHDVKALWAMPTFHNPTGVTLSLEKKKALVELLAKYHVPLIEDDVYGELHHGSEYSLPAKAFDRDGLVMHCSSFSKSLAPGYRIGWVAGGRYAETLRKLKLMTTLSSGAPTQAAIANYLGHGGFDKHLRKLRTSLENQLDQMDHALSRVLPAGSGWFRPDGGYFLWVELPFVIDPLMLHDRAIAKGLSIAPGAMFSATKPLGNSLRLNFGHPWTASTEEAVKTLGRLLIDLPRKT